MTEKFEIYDLLAVLVPGSLVIGAGTVLFPDLAKAVGPVAFPDAFAVVLLVSLAVFVGQLVQAIASLTEPLLEMSWGGRASERAFRRGLGERYLPHPTALRIREKLVAALGKDQSQRSVFIFAMSLAEAAPASRVPRFNALYAYHRALCSLVTIGWVLVLTSIIWGAAASWPTIAKWVAVVGGLLLIVLVWFRTKQRGFYYVREVLLTAERVLRDKPQHGNAS